MDRKCHCTITDWLCTIENTGIITRRFWEWIFERKKKIIWEQNMSTCYKQLILEVSTVETNRDRDQDVSSCREVFFQTVDTFSTCQDKSRSRCLVMSRSPFSNCWYFLDMLRLAFWIVKVESLDWDSVKKWDFRA